MYGDMVLQTEDKQGHKSTRAQDFRCLPYIHRLPKNKVKRNRKHVGEARPLQQCLNKQGWVAAKPGERSVVRAKRAGLHVGCMYPYVQKNRPIESNEDVGE